MHHVIPKYLGGHLSDMVRIDAQYHQMITSAFRALAPYGKKVPSAEDLKVILVQVYTQLPIPLTNWIPGGR